MTPEQKSSYWFARHHGATIAAAARKARIDEDAAQRLEGKRWCDECGAYVCDEECVHWDYES
jgi:hypothetical protein